MPFKNVPIIKADFEALSWQNVINECTRKECNDYYSHFFTKAKETEAIGNEKAQEIFTLLGAICSLFLRSENRDEPFGPMIILYNSRSAIIDDITNEHLVFLQEIIEEISDPELQARVADIIWIRKKDFKAAGIAIDAYLKSASILKDPEKWHLSFERIERAFRIALQLGKGGNYHDTVIYYIEKLLAEYNGYDPKFLSARLMELLLEQRHGDPNKYAVLSKKIAQEAEKGGNYYKAKVYWGIKSRWDELGGNTAVNIQSIVHIAEIYIKEADKANSAIESATHVVRAIETLRRVGGQKERIEAIHSKLLGIQKGLPNEMKTFSHEMDISEVVEKYRNSVIGMSFQDAIFNLCLLAGSPKVSKLRARVEESVRNYPLQFLFSGVIINENGRVIGRKPHMMSNDPLEVEKAKQAEMHLQAQYDRNFITVAFIEPIRDQILSEHYVQARDFYFIVSNNPFVPPGRESIFIKGLNAGMQGDYLTATHLLMPQVENSIRYLLEQNGVTVSKLDAYGIQDEKSLNELLYLPEVDKIFGEDIAFDLRGLLVERYGANLRNRVAHGLIPYGNFYTYESSYFWWLTIRLCCLPIIDQMKAHQQKSSSINE